VVEQDVLLLQSLNNSVCEARRVIYNHKIYRISSMLDSRYTQLTP